MTTVAGTGSALWYLSRGTGVISLVLLTLVTVLGVLTRGGVTVAGLPRFVVAGLHRNVSLLALVFLAGHVVSAVADPYASIRVVDVVVPFVSSYRPVWLGLGAVALDLLLAVVVTSLLRLRIGQRLWRAVHWAAYAAFPVAVVHGLGTGTDVRQGWLLLLTAVCVASVVVAGLWRAARASAAPAQWRFVAVSAAVVAPLALVVWTKAGPLAPHWAARSGTPAALIAHPATVTGSGSVVAGAVPAGTAQMAGTISEQQGNERSTIVLSAGLRGGPGGRLRVVLAGRTLAGGGVDLTSGHVSLHPSDGSTWSGPVTGLSGGQVDAALTGPAGRTVTLAADLRLDPAGSSFTGEVRLG